MHDHDLDLIAAYADGTLDGPADEAERLVATCPECRAELEAQRAVRSWLAEAPAVSMTEAERTSLHTRLRAELAPPAPVVPLTRRRPWVAIGAVAATLLVAVGVAGVFQAMQQGGAEDEAAELAVATTAGDTAAGDLSAPAEAESAPATTAPAAVAETTAPSPPAVIVDLGEVTSAALAENARDLVAALDADGRYVALSASEFREAERALPQCLPPGEVFAVIEATVEGEPVQVFVVPHPETGRLVAEAYRVDGCVPFQLS